MSKTVPDDLFLITTRPVDPQFDALQGFQYLPHSRLDRIVECTFMLIETINIAPLGSSKVRNGLLKPLDTATIWSC